MSNSFFLSMFQWRSQTLHRRHLLSRRCQSASPPVTLRSPRSRPGWPWPSGRPKPGATVRRSSNNPPPRRDTGLWPALRLHTAPRTLRHLESHRPPPRPPSPLPKLNLTVNQVKPSITSWPPHTLAGTIIMLKCASHSNITILSHRYM